ESAGFTQRAGADNAPVPAHGRFCIVRNLPVLGTCHPASDGERPLHILCPHCRNSIEEVRLKPREEIACPSCGSSFRLETESTTPVSRDGHKVGRFEMLDRQERPMPEIVLINPRFEVSYWGMEYALPLFGKKCNVSVAALPLLAALTPPGFTVRLIDEN